MATNVCPRLERLVTLHDQPPVFAIPLDRLVGQQPAAARPPSTMMPATSFFTRPDRNRIFAPVWPPSPGNNSPICGSNLQNLLYSGVPTWQEIFQPNRQKPLDGRLRSPVAKPHSSSAASPETTPHTRRWSSNIIVWCSGLATHLLGDREEALDLSQEVFLRVFRTLHRFRASRRYAPGSSGSSSTRCGTASAGGSAANGRIRYRSTITSAITARWCWAPMRRRPIAS